MNGQVNFLLFQKHAETNRARIVTQARPVLKLAGDFFCTGNLGQIEVKNRPCNSSRPNSRSSADNRSAACPRGRFL